MKRLILILFIIILSNSLFAKIPAVIPDFDSTTTNIIFKDVLKDIKNIEKQKVLITIKKINPTKLTSEDFYTYNIIYGCIYTILQKPDSSLLYFNKSFELQKKHNYINNFTPTLYLNASRALMIKRKINDSYKALHKLNTLIDNNKITLDNNEKLELNELMALNNYYNKSYDKTKKYLDKGLDLAHQTKDSVYLNNYYNIYSMYYFAKSDTMKAKEYLLNIIDISKKTNDISSLAMAYNNIAVIYESNKQYDSLRYFLMKSIKINSKLAQYYQLSFNYLNYSEVLNNLNIIDSVYYYLNKTNQIIQKDNYQMLKPYVYKAYSNYFKKINRLDSALYYKEKELEVTIDINQKNKEQEINRIETEYQIEHNEKEKQLLRKDLKLKDSEILRNYFIISGSLIIIITFIIIYYLKIKNERIIQKQNKMLQEKNDELSIAYDELTVVNNELNENQLKLSDTLHILDESNKSKDKFMSIISHDLKNPLNGLILISELILMKFDEIDREELKKKINQIKDISHHTISLLQNLLQWALSQSDRIAFNPENINISEIIENIINLMENSIKEKNISLEVNMFDEYICFADRNMLETSFRNLISNAVKFTDDNGKITISLEKQNNFINVTIIDTGIGMTEKEISNLFTIDKTVSKKGTHNEKGTGLGLIITKEFIDKHHGQIDVESKIDEGTKFTVTIPA